MEKCRINEPGNEGPGFLWVPTPVTAPSIMCPSRPGDDSHRQHGESNNDRPVIDFIQRFCIRQPSNASGDPLPSMLNQKEKADPEGDGKSGVAEKAGDDVDGKPIALQCRH